MTGLYGRPTAAELVAVVADFLDNDVRNATGPDGRLADGPDGRLADGPDGRLADASQVNFHARVAANVLRIVERELLAGTPTDVTDALAALGFADEEQLAAAIREGGLDDRPEAVQTCLRTLVRRRVDVAHPGYADP